MLVISKQNSLRKFLQELNKEIEFNLKITPHPSNQNISKIKTVSDIFKSLGNINQNDEWEKLGYTIDKEYKKLLNELKSKE